MEQQKGRGGGLNSPVFCGRADAIDGDECSLGHKLNQYEGVFQTLRSVQQLCWARGCRWHILLNM